MASRKQKIKQKREQEQKEARRVQLIAILFGVLVLLGIGAYIVVDSGVFEPPAEVLGDYTGTPQEICEQATPASGGGVDGEYSSAPNDILENGVDYQAIFCTTQGAIYLDLFEDQTPITVNNMVFLASEGYYNNTIFHRVLDGFMAQAGDPTGTGRGGPGYQFTDEIVPTLTFDRPYLLAMANAGAGTNGSQFFITFAPTDWLNGAHTIFGEVISGQEVVDSLNRVDPQSPNPNITPSDLQTVIIVTPDQVTQ
ncbi:MAG: peptidylprolyl isomerase [Phototrophicaceae bacterium]